MKDLIVCGVFTRIVIARRSTRARQNRHDLEESFWRGDHDREKPQNEHDEHVRHEEPNAAEGLPHRAKSGSLAEGSEPSATACSRALTAVEQ